MIIRRSVLTVFLKQVSYSLLQILCKMLFFKRNWYSDHFDFTPGGSGSISWNGINLVSLFQYLFLLCMQPQPLYCLCMKTKITINLDKHMNTVVYIFFFYFLQFKPFGYNIFYFKNCAFGYHKYFIDLTGSCWHVIPKC